MGMAAPTYWTADMVRALPEDGNRYEVVYGELLVTPSPRMWHEVLIHRLFGALHEYLTREPVGIVLGSRADISRADDVLVQPDVFVVPLDEARTLAWVHIKRLPLIAEVLSPSTARADRFLKRRRYQEAGIPVYWIVDGDAHQVEVWTPDAHFPQIERGRLTWHPAGAATEFGLSCEHLFRPV